MTNQKPQQDWESRFDERFGVVIDGAFAPTGKFESKPRPQAIKTFIFTEQINLLNEVREMIEGMKKEIDSRYYQYKPNLTEEEMEECAENTGYNQALDSLLTKLKDNIR